MNRYNMLKYNLLIYAECQNINKISTIYKYRNSIWLAYSPLATNGW